MKKAKGNKNFNSVTSNRNGENKFSAGKRKKKRQKILTFNDVNRQSLNERDAFKVHGLLYEEISDSGSGKSDLDEEYFKYKPKPLELTRNKIVTIHSSVPDNQWQRRAETQKEKYKYTNVTEIPSNSSTTVNSLEKGRQEKLMEDTQKGKYNGNARVKEIPTISAISGNDAKKNADYELKLPESVHKLPIRSVARSGISKIHISDNYVSNNKELNIPKTESIRQNKNNNLSRQTTNNDAWKLVEKNLMEDTQKGKYDGNASIKEIPSISTISGNNTKKNADNKLKLPESVHKLPIRSVTRSGISKIHITDNYVSNNKELSIPKSESIRQNRNNNSSRQTPNDVWKSNEAPYAFTNNIQQISYDKNNIITPKVHSNLQELLNNTYVDKTQHISHSVYTIHNPSQRVNEDTPIEAIAQSNQNLTEEENKELSSEANSEEKATFSFKSVFNRLFCCEKCKQNAK